METIKIHTSQNIEIDYAIASLGNRIKARAIDYSIFMGVYTVCVIAFVGSSSYEKNIAPGWGFGIAMLVWLILCVFYDLVMEIFFNGQSIGKRVSKISVISLDGQRPTVGQYIIRWLFRIIDFGVTMGTAGLVTVAVSDYRQRIGDMAAGTVVVKTEPITRYKDLTFKEIDVDHEITYQQVAKLSDEDLTLIHDVLNNFARTRNNLMVYKLAIRIKNYLGVTYPDSVNEYQFLKIIVHDYIGYTTNG